MIFNIKKHGESSLPTSLPTSLSCLLVLLCASVPGAAVADFPSEIRQGEQAVKEAEEEWVGLRPAGGEKHKKRRGRAPEDDGAASHSSLEAADPLVRLHQFLQMKTFKAAFSQVVYDTKQNVIVNSLGTVVLSRPGRFRWEYTAPNRQSIVSDGLNLIVYDPELRQASVQPVVEALGDAPITLLMGRYPVFDRFEVERGGRRDGLEWVSLTPKSQDLEFTRIELGLDAEKVVRMEMLDHFEQTTVINFLRPQLSPEVAADAFRLHLPQSVDVVGQYALPRAR